MQIKVINYGVAFYCDGSIEVNKNLKKYPGLYDEVIKHELKHSKSKSHIQDLWIDFKDFFKIKKRFMLIGFCLKYPKDLIADSPFYFDNGNLSYNLFNIILKKLHKLRTGNNYEITSNKPLIAYHYYTYSSFNGTLKAYP